MRAWQVRNFGSFRDPGTLELGEVPPPVPEEGCALVRVRAAGVNFPDTLIIAGKYQVRPPLPFTPGFEAAGEIVELGPGCSGFAVGDRVVCWTPRGAFTEYASVRCDHMFRAPAGMSDEEAAVYLVSYQTAWFSIIHRAALRAGETLVVHGGAGAIGSAAIELGKAAGATVIATAGTPEKEAICRRLGADHTIDHSTRDVSAVVRELTGNGANVILDAIGGDLLERSLRCIAWEGRIVTIGFTSGVIPSIPANRILLKNISVVGLYWGEYWKHDPALIHTAQAKLDALYAEGKIRPLVGKVFALEELPQALDAVLDRANYGKHVVKP
jgi:NADPH:quinone reductase